MKISAYTTARNVLAMKYPFKESINSMMAFADEVIVLDTSDGTDSTSLELKKIEQDTNHKVVITTITNFGWEATNHGILDGAAKACARSLCDGDALFQFDLDEIVHEDHAPLIRPIAQSLDLNRAPLIALPVVEYWGRTNKIRIDVNLWKWRLSVNDPNITHGIPGRLRKQGKDGLLYAQHGTDGCDYIYKSSLEPVPCVGCIPTQLNAVHHHLSKYYSQTGLLMVQDRFNEILDKVPGVFHYSWWNIERKIQQYKQFWTGFWPSLYDEQRDERSNPFFPGLLWSEVTDEMIKTKAFQLEQGCCGHIFHTPWDGQETYGIQINKTHPEIMKEYLK